MKLWIVHAVSTLKGPIKAVDDQQLATCFKKYLAFRTLLCDAKKDCGVRRTGAAVSEKDFSGNEDRRWVCHYFHVNIVQKYDNSIADATRHYKMSICP